MKKWNSIDIQPPDELLEVMDENGNIGEAMPTYYGFDIVDSKVVFVNKYWDGGWLIKLSISDHFDSKIIKWRTLTSR